MPVEVRNIKNIIIKNHTVFPMGVRKVKKKGNRDGALRKATDLQDFLSPCHWFEEITEDRETGFFGGVTGTACGVCTTTSISMTN